MKNTTATEIGTLKNTSETVSKNIKEGIKALIDTNSKQVSAALDANSKIFNAISKVLYEHEVDPAIVSKYKSTLIKGLELSENAINSIIDAGTKNVNQSVEFTNKFIETIKSQDLDTEEGQNKLIALVKENLDKANELSAESMKKMSSIYNEHLNLALNFNKKFADIVNAQVESMLKLQHKSFDPLEIVHTWWKQDSTEKVKV